MDRLAGTNARAPTAGAAAFEWPMPERRPSRVPEPCAAVSCPRRFDEFLLGRSTCDMMQSYWTEGARQLPTRPHTARCWDGRRVPPAGLPVVVGSGKRLFAEGATALGVHTARQRGHGRWRDPPAPAADSVRDRKGRGRGRLRKPPAGRVARGPQLVARRSVLALGWDRGALDFWLNERRVVTPLEECHGRNGRGVASEGWSS